MQGLTFELLEKMEALCIDMRKVAVELGSTVRLIQSGASLTEATRSKLSIRLISTLTRLTADSVTTVPSGELLCTFNDETLGAKLMEFADEDFSIEVNSNMTLHSLKATSNVEEKKRLESFVY
uniref:Transcriptional regulator n=1 Tax=Angiostrongylus cantonensis TaxID=6313 RepID=A0A0K0D351_ANGCA